MEESPHPESHHFIYHKLIPISSTVDFKYKTIYSHSYIYMESQLFHLFLDS